MKRDNASGKGVPETGTRQNDRQSPSAPAKPRSARPEKTAAATPGGSRSTASRIDKAPTPQNSFGPNAAQSAQPDKTRRAMGGRALGAILPQVTRPAFNKRPAPAVRLILDWAEIVGPALAAQTEPRRVSAGTLTIACTGPVALELQHLAPQLIERINNHCGPMRTGRDLRFDDGTSLVRKIRILQDPSVMRAVTPAARSAPRPVEIPDMKQGELQEVLARLGGHIRRRPRR